MPYEKTRVTPLILLFASLIMGFLYLSSYTVLAASTVHGNIYEWTSFDTLKNAEVVVNTVPEQVMISKNGSYSFNLGRGTYTIIARSGGNTSEELFAMDNVTIEKDGGDYVVDLILFPSNDFNDMAMFNESSTFSSIASVYPAEASLPQQNSGLGLFIGAFVAGIVVIGLFVVLYFRMRKKPYTVSDITIPDKAQVSQGSSPIVEAPTGHEMELTLPSPKPVLSSNAYLPADLRMVIGIIEKSGGRITQKDLRKALPYSEAKVSLMITNLEIRGIIRKIKKGNSNVIILTKSSNVNP